MARLNDRDLVQLGPWARGANNIAREESVPGSAFRRGINVDVYPGGKLRRRHGKTLVDPTPTRNLWSDGRYALCTSTDCTALYRFVPGLAPKLLYSGLRVDADVTYCSVNHLVYVSDEVRALCVDTTDDSVRSWGVPSPSGQPTLEATSGGLDAGAYQVAMTYVGDSGEESGTGQAASIEVAANGGIRARWHGAVPGVSAINVYFSRVGGGEMLLYGSYPPTALDVVLSRQALGRPLRTFALEPMPAGHAAALVGGRFVVAKDNLLIWSDPLNYGLTNLAKNFIPYGGGIDLLAPTVQGAAADGVFVAAGAKTYFLAGADITNSANRLAYASGAVRGAPVYINGDAHGVDGLPSVPLPTWLAQDGYVCIGLPDGSVRALTGGRYAMPNGDRAVLARREFDGIEQLLVNVRNPTQSQAATADSADTVLVRNGVVIP